MSRTLFWFRNDLRQKDNPGLCAAAQKGTVLPIYILDTDQTGLDERGAASKWWLHNSLQNLRNNGVPVQFFKGKPQKILHNLKETYDIDGLYWNRCYDPYSMERDKKIKAQIDNCYSYNGSLLTEPQKIINGSGSFYKVFTPYWRAALESFDQPRGVLESPSITYFQEACKESVSLEELSLLPESEDWYEKFSPHWCPGEKGAHKALSQFLEHGLTSYKVDRDFPAKPGTSRLSPHLHFGEISPHQIWEAVYDISDQRNEHVKTFLSELGWREFSYYLLFHNQNLKTEPFQDKFSHMEWEDEQDHFSAWKRGRTGYPIVDAGMRELWETGYMHNRVRMIVASFLTKHCLIHWRHGEQWFWDCLVDADPASNVAGWQWVAGCGADAAPFFRIFNPVTQSEKFDPDGNYIKKYVPELKGFTGKDIHKPFLASKAKQQNANCELGKDYPYPIVDLKEGRERALSRFKDLSNK